MSEGVGDGGTGEDEEAADEVGTSEMEPPVEWVLTVEGVFERRDNAASVLDSTAVLIVPAVDDELEEYDETREGAELMVEERDEDLE